MFSLAPCFLYIVNMLNLDFLARISPVRTFNYKYTSVNVASSNNVMCNSCSSLLRTARC